MSENLNISKTFHPQGRLHCLYYYYSHLGNICFHREDGPAFLEYRKNGFLKTEAFYLKNQLHRENGPCFIEYNEDGSVKECYFALEGERILFWAFFECSDNEVQKDLLKRWLPYSK
jgi:hypothetical protein